MGKQNCCCLTRNIQKSNSKAKRKDKVEQNELILQKWERVLVEIAKKIHPQSAMAILEIQEGLRNLKLMPHLNLVYQRLNMYVIKIDPKFREPCLSNQFLIGWSQKMLKSKKSLLPVRLLTNWC